MSRGKKRDGSAGEGPEGAARPAEASVRLTVATNFAPELLEAIKGYPVYELFGKLPADYGFLHFVSGVDCHERDCEECRYCHRVADRAVKIDPRFRREVLRRYDEVLDDLRSGAMWTYGRRDPTERRSR